MQETGHNHQNNQNPNVQATGRGEAMHGKYNRLKLGDGEIYARLRD
jgi:hypothetical protein